MTELTPSYSGTNIEYTCPNCGAFIGVERDEGNGKRLFIAGRFPATAYHGECPNPQCRVEFHYTAKDSLPPFIAQRYNKPGAV